MTQSAKPKERGAIFNYSENWDMTTRAMEAGPSWSAFNIALLEWFQLQWYQSWLSLELRENPRKSFCCYSLDEHSDLFNNLFLSKYTTLVLSSFETKRVHNLFTVIMLTALLADFWWHHCFLCRIFPPRGAVLSVLYVSLTSCNAMSTWQHLIIFREVCQSDFETKTTTTKKTFIEINYALCSLWT